jgi:uncharacterized protein with NRDE domain
MPPTVTAHHASCAGSYGLSNHRLDTPWPKLVQARTAFAAALPALRTKRRCSSARRTADRPDRRYRDGVPIEWERLLSAVSSVRKITARGHRPSAWRSHDGRVRLHERSFAPSGESFSPR